MKTHQNGHQFNGLDDRLDAIEERLEILESGGGSGATDCYAGREAGKEQDEAQGRSREDRRVTPGEAEAIRHVIAAFLKDASRPDEWGDRENASGISITIEAHREELASCLRKCAGMILQVIQPKPDSEAVEDERSGRRNDEADSRRARSARS